MLSMWDLLLVVLGLLAAFYYYLSWNLGHWKARGVYSLPGALPGVGHMWENLMFRLGAQFLSCQIYHEAKGHPAVGIFAFRQPILLLRDLDLVQTVLIKEFSSFYDNTAAVNEDIDIYVSKNPFFMKDQRWKNLRQKLTPAFSPARIKMTFPLIQNVCEEFTNYIKKHLNEELNINEVTGLFTSEVVAKCAFGLDGNAFHDPDAPFYQNGRKLWDGSINNSFEVLLHFFFPSINKILKRGYFPKEPLAFFENIVKQTVEYREKNPDKAADNDYLQFLINIKNKKEFTFVDVVAQCMTFFTDGFETSSVTASFVLYELAMNPEIQEAVRQEVQGMDSFSYDNISALPLLDRVLKETLRRYSIFALTKTCTKDCTLESNGLSFPVRKGDHIWVPAYAIHHDPDIYPNPDEFDPDRFLPENVKNRHPMSYMPFGAGPRICLGNRFGSCQVKMLVSNILANFKLVKSDKTVEKITLNPLLPLPNAQEGVWLQFQKL
uniref:Cytochrome P450 n=1 Tax=Graphocephala atropunctata TaxID=36148 RepID=A0A1B6M3Z0_9HEMI